MPLPTPNSGENREEFLQRCMGNPTMIEDFPDNSQRYAVCIRQFTENRKTPTYDNKEYRFMDISASEEMIIEGYAIRFNEPAIFEINGEQYKEIIDSRALDMANMEDIPLKYNHSDNIMIMARTRNKTLELTKNNNGLFIKAKLADTSAGRDLYTLVKRGDIDKMSFAFTIEENGDEYNRETRTRTIKNIKKIWDVSGVDTPAYNSTTLSARSFFDLEKEKERIEVDTSLVRKRMILKLKTVGGNRNVL